MGFTKSRKAMGVEKEQSEDRFIKLLSVIYLLYPTSLDNGTSIRTYFVERVYIIIHLGDYFYLLVSINKAFLD